jgi:hypothetical protein
MIAFGVKSRFLVPLSDRWKAKIIVKQLLNHTSGLCSIGWTLNSVLVCPVESGKMARPAVGTVMMVNQSPHRTFQSGVAPWRSGYWFAMIGRHEVAHPVSP